METEGLNIRLITTEAEYENVLIKALLKERWRPGLQDAHFFLTCDPTGTFVGELNGKPIGWVKLTKYGENFGFVGSFIVDKEYRGKGYGTKILNTALASVEPSRNIGLIAEPHVQKMYEKRGFRGRFNVVCFDFHLPTAFRCFSETPREILKKSPVRMSSVDQVDEKALLVYDSTVFGFPRHAFLTKWVRAPGSHAHIAIDEEGSIVGYVVARATFLKEHGYKIGPLFADSDFIAEKLLKAVFEELLQQNDPPPVVCIDALQQNAMELAQKLQGKIVYKYAYMTTEGALPNACFDKWFGMTDTDLG